MTSYIIDPNLENLITESIHSTSNGDYPALPPEATEQVFKITKELNQEEGMTIVVVTHDTRVAETAKRIIHITDGRIAG